MPLKNEDEEVIEKMSLLQSNAGLRVLLDKDEV